MARTVGGDRGDGAASPAPDPRPNDLPARRPRSAPADPHRRGQRAPDPRGHAGDSRLTTDPGPGAPIQHPTRQKDHTPNRTENTVTTTECKHCAGTGEVDGADNLDLDSIDAVRAELLSVVNSTTYGMASEHQHDRMNT